MESARPLDLPALALAMVLAAAFVWAFFPAWTGLLHAWQASDDYAHGFFIVPLFLFLLWRDRAELARIPFKTSWLGLAAFLLALAAYLFGLFAGIATLASLALVMAVAGGTLFLFGGRVLRRAAFPLFLLLFMIPVPAQLRASLTAPLQLLVSKASVLAIRLLDIPVYREGNILHLPERSFQVIQACSGLRSVISLLTLSLVLSFFALGKTGFRLLLFLAAIPVALLVNAVRVILTIVVLHYFGVDLTDDRFHTLFGLGIFVIALALLFLLQKGLSQWESAFAAKRSS